MQPMNLTHGPFEISITQPELSPNIASPVIIRITHPGFPESAILAQVDEQAHVGAFIPADLLRNFHHSDLSAALHVAWERAQPHLPVYNPAQEDRQFAIAQLRNLIDSAEPVEPLSLDLPDDYAPKERE